MGRRMAVSWSRPTVSLPTYSLKRVKVGSVTLVPKWTQMLLLGSTGQIGAIGLVGRSHAVQYRLFGTFFPSLPP